MTTARNDQALAHRPEQDAVAVSVRDVGVVFGGFRALEGVSLEVPVGQIVGVIGPNGAGKTTLLNVISRLVPMATGSATVLGHDVAGLRPYQVARLGVSRTFQLAESFSSLSVADFMLLGCRDVPRGGAFRAVLDPVSRYRSERRLRERVVDELARFGLESVSPDAELGSLAYGVRKRVDLARATLTRPRLLLLDEPTSGVSAAESEKIAELLEQVHTVFGVTVLMVDHQVEFVRRVCSEVLALGSGKPLAHGPCDQVLEDPAVSFAFLGRTG